jgi:hypothetical protein
LCAVLCGIVLLLRRRKAKATTACEDARPTIR